MAVVAMSFRRIAVVAPACGPGASMVAQWPFGTCCPGFAGGAGTPAEQLALKLDPAAAEDVADAERRRLAAPARGLPPGLGPARAVQLRDLPPVAHRAADAAREADHDPVQLELLRA